MKDYLSKIKDWKKVIARHQIFLRHLVDDPTRNATQAAIKSSYKEKNANRAAAAIMTNPHVKSVLAEYEKLVAADNADLRLAIIKELSLIAFSDVKTFLSWAKDSLKLTDSDELPENVSRVIEEVSETLNQYGGTKKIRLHNKIAALKELNKMHGFYAPVEQIFKGEDGKPLPTINIMLPSNGREKK